MPGIAGIIGRAKVEHDLIQRMTKCMAHEPFYVTGTHINDDLGLGVGWVNHAGSYADCMPIWNERRDVCLIFSGENFMDRDEFAALLGGRSEEQPNTVAALLALYDACGLAFVEKLNGWFSGLLIDLRNKFAILFNDRYGLGRIYYHECDETVYFASEAKSLLEVLPKLRKLDLRGVAESFACGCVLQNRTLYEGVSLLPGGAMWRFGAKGTVVKQRYFNRKTWEEQAKLEPDEFDDALKQTFKRILPKYLYGANRIGMSLTGGLDGRMIMAWARMSERVLPCYTFSGPYRECADVAIARQVAALCGMPFQPISIGEDFIADFPRLAEKAILVSDGAMDVTGAVELHANRLAREIAPIRLTGNYGSEVMRANVAFRPMKTADMLLNPEFAKMTRIAGETYQIERSVPILSFIAFKQTPWHHYSRLATEQSQLTVRSPFLDNEFVALMYRAPEELRASKDPSLRLIHEGNPRLDVLPTDRGQIYGDTSVLRKFRQRLIALEVKAEYAYDYGMPHGLARIDRLLSPLHLERLFLGRHKFYHFRIWYRDRLSNYVKEILLDPRSRQRSYLQGDVLEQMVKAHTDGTQNWTRELHRVLTLELLQRLLIER